MRRGLRRRLLGRVRPERPARSHPRNLPSRASRRRPQPARVASETPGPLAPTCDVQHFVTRVTSCYVEAMAWNIVIAGGGFGGLAAARELEKVMPKQSARLMMVNETNYSTYTPFLPEAAAGTLEPRHVVTPLREILNRTYIRLGEIVGHDPEAKTVELKAQSGGNETIPYDQLLLSLGSVSRTLPIPGLIDHAMGFKGLADAIVLRNRIIENLEEANATGDHQRREELLTFVFVGGGYAGPRGAGRAPGLRRRRDGLLPARPPPRDALDPGRGGAAGAAGDRPGPRRLRPARAARPRHRHQAGDAAERGDGELGDALDRRDGADHDRRLDRGRRPGADPQRPQPAARRPRPGAGRRPPAGRGARLGLGDRRLRRRPRPARRHSARRPPSTRSAKARSRRATSPPSSASATPSPSPTAARPRS